MPLDLKALPPVVFARRAIHAVDHFFFEPIDARVYVAVRVTYAVVTLANLLEIWPVRRILLGSDGMLARPPWLAWYLPLRWITSDAGVTAFMVSVGICAVFMAVGFLTRLSALVLYLWAVSYEVAMNPATAGYDALIRIGAFVLLLAPPARLYAVDGWLFGRGPSTLPRYALRLLQWQLVVVYTVTVWLKVPDPYWRSGQLLAFFFMSVFSRVPSPAWAHWGRLCAVMTWSSLMFEATIPFLLFNRRLRRLGFAFGLLLHGGIALTSVAGMFSLCMVPYYAAFLQAEDLDALQSLGAALWSRRFPFRALPARAAGP
jgi:hypothetical protein